MREHLHDLSLYGDTVCHGDGPPEALSRPDRMLAQPRRRLARGTLAIIVTKLQPVKTARRAISSFTQLALKQRDALARKGARYAELSLQNKGPSFASSPGSQKFPEHE